MFRGKESSNRIELSQLGSRLIEFWCFGLPAALGVGVGWMGVVGRCSPHMCTCTHMHTCTRTHGEHDNFMQMAAPIGGIPGITL